MSDHQVNEAEETEGEDVEDVALSFSELLFGGEIDHSAKAAAMIRLFGAFERLDIKAISQETGVDAKSLSEALPQTFAQQLVEDFLGMMLTTDNIGEFVAHGVEVINSIACAIVSMTSDIDQKLLSQLVSYMADYNAAKSGSTAEVFADKRIGETIDEINEAVVSNNAPLAAGYVNDETGFKIASANAFAEYDTMDEEDAEIDDEDDLSNVTRHG